MNSQWHDPAIADWLAEGPDRGSVQGLERALAAARRVDQRLRWTYPAWWLPRSPAAGMRLALVGVLLVLVALLVATIAVSLIGSDSRIRSLLGPSGDALIAYQDGQQISVARVDGSGRRSISEPDAIARSPLFSPGGRHVVFLQTASVDATTGQLMLADIEARDPPVSISAGLDVIVADVPSIDWSPDGSRVAFAARGASGSAIFVVSLDGSPPVRVSGDLGAADLPGWSPDGEWVAYRTIEPDGFRRHHRQVRPDGTDDQDLVVVIADDGYLSRLRWSPVPADIALVSLSYFQNVGFGSDTMAMIDLRAGHTVEPWTEGAGGWADNGVPWSPDGGRLAILTATDGVIVADAAQTGDGYDGDLLRLGPVADCWVEWTPDGSALYGGSPDECEGTVVIPLREPSAAETLPGSSTGTASWQPLP